MPTSGSSAQHVGGAPGFLAQPQEGSSEQAVVLPSSICLRRDSESEHRSYSLTRFCLELLVAPARVLMSVSKAMVVRLEIALVGKPVYEQKQAIKKAQQAVEAAGKNHQQAERESERAEEALNNLETKLKEQFKRYLLGVVYEQEMAQCSGEDHYINIGLETVFETCPAARKVKSDADQKQKAAEGAAAALRAEEQKLNDARGASRQQRQAPHGNPLTRMQMLRLPFSLLGWVVKGVALVCLSLVDKGINFARSSLQEYFLPAGQWIIETLIKKFLNGLEGILASRKISDKNAVGAPGSNSQSLEIVNNTLLSAQLDIAVAVAFGKMRVEMEVYEVASYKDMFERILGEYDNLLKELSSPNFSYENLQELLSKYLSTSNIKEETAFISSMRDKALAAYNRAVAANVASYPSVNSTARNDFVATTTAATVNDADVNYQVVCELCNRATECLRQSSERLSPRSSPAFESVLYT